VEEESRRVRYVALQAGRSATTAREQRLAYLQAQLDGLRSECGQLALLTGTPFEPQKAASIAAVVDSLKQNEARNASLHSFLQVEQALVEAVKDDIGRLTLEADLIERGAQAANGARTDGAAEAESRSQAHELTVRTYRKLLADAHAERDAVKVAARAAKHEMAVKAGEARKCHVEAEARAQQSDNELLKLQIALHHSGVLAAMQRLQEGYCLEGEERAHLLAAAAAASSCVKCGSRKLKQHGVKDC